jgi:hypothetical protein
MDINLIKDSNLLLHAIHSPFYWWILKETIFMNSGKMREENSRLRRLEFMPRNID